MEEKNPGVEFAPDTDTESKVVPKHETHPGFKETTVPPVRFWILSVG